MRKVRFLLLLMCAFLLLSGCANNGYKSIEEAMQHAGIQYKQIHHQHGVKNGIIIFYENPNRGIDAGIVYKNNDGFKWGFGGGTAPYPSTEKDITWAGVNLDLKYIDKDVELVELRDGTRLWFALQNEYSEFHPEPTSSYESYLEV
ncbi:hypothetical protein [Paenibacillus beijingensis]|uniref:DUF4825 domain-containing protein n=1 Tax=Paenibacillus beijingensis TaxID=1126833 RepID=A0A0D5NNH0_9BACL|nr:hypothetical protein [Paenibacillus beijingensis]AJY76854.1 hypothetical protein VN24_22695 [Paenibacillus beijingensis]